MTSQPAPFTPPSTILIIGSGVFGLSTVLALTQRSLFSATRIILLDRSPFPSPDGSSIDTSRIIRADYSLPAYATLASKAQHLWRTTPGLSDVYSESGLVLVADTSRTGEDYVRKSWANTRALMRAAEDDAGCTELKDRKAIDAAVGTGGGSGDWGYVNHRSGWADAEAAMCWLRARVKATGRVDFLLGEATSLTHSGHRVTGAQLSDDSSLSADLTIVATGAWSGKLVDLRGRAEATAQVLSYLDLTAEEQSRLGRMPVLLNMSSGLFIIPPHNRVLKVARHAYGYSNPTAVPDPAGAAQSITISTPRTKRDDPTQEIPAEGEQACRAALREMIPELGERPFSKTRICWYMDTPKGDFLIAYHPRLEGLFLATGGSGHGFKFLPVIGERIVDCVEGRCEAELAEMWKWPQETVKNVVTEDGSRGGGYGLVLDKEMARGNGER